MVEHFPFVLSSSKHSKPFFSNRLMVGTSKIYGSRASQMLQLGFDEL